MAQKVQVKAKPPINIERFAMWKMIDEDNETYGSVIDFDRRVMSFRDTLTTNSTPLYGTGVVVDRATAVNEGTLSYNIHAMTADERVAAYGETKNSANAVITTSDDIIPYVATAHATRKRDGKWNLYKYLKVQFQPHEESTEQITQGNITYSTIVLNGTYMESEVHEMMRAILLDVDPKTAAGAATIENWFTNPTYVGIGGMNNTSTIKVGNDTIENGGTITSGSTVTFNGSATGGTSPYTYSFYYRAVGSDTWTAKAEDSSTATATQAITVVSDTDYEFKLVVKDANGITLTRIFTVTVEASE